MQTLKCVVVGDQGVGKSSLISTFIVGNFTPVGAPRVLESTTKEMIIYNKPVSLCIWDVIGDDEHVRMRPLSYFQTDIFIICFSVISPSSFANVQNKWIPEIQEQIHPDHVN